MLRQLPLRHTLPLIVAGLTVIVLLLTVVFASIEVRRSAHMAAEERLNRVAQQIAGIAGTSAATREATLRRVGREPVLAALIAGDVVDADALHDAIEALRTPADSGLPVQLWDRDRRIVYSDVAGDPIAAPDGVAPAPRAPLDTVPRYGAFHPAGAQVRYYSTAPVMAGDELLGWIVQHRRIGNPRSAEELQSLIGRNARVLFSFPGDSLWITLSGQAVPAPTRVLPIDTVLTVTAGGGGPMLVTAREVAGTPWSVLIEMPASAAGVGPGAFLVRMLLFGAGLIAGAIVAAWLIGRRLTSPLTELVAASEAVARGDYAQRVTPRVGGDEVVRLAASYNVMAAQVSLTHDALRRRLEEARALAAELEAAKIEAERGRAAAQAGDRAKSEFVATMSHEIRTPINAVLGFCDLLELDGIGEATRRDYISRTRRAARRLAALVEDVLDLAKVDAGEVRIQPEIRRVHETIDGALALVEEEILRKSLHVERVVDADAAYAADPQRVEQILINLLSNAVKFTPAGGRIEVRAGSAPGDGRQVRIEVADSGIGVAADELDRIFEPFVQAQSGYTRQYGGTGLGLSISRRLARLMDGDVVARSETGAGSTFVLTLPAAVSSAVTAA